MEEDNCEVSEECFERADENVEMPKDVVTLAEAGDLEVEDDEFDPFWFCGPPAADPLQKEDEKSKQDKMSEKEITDEDSNRDKMWEGEDGQDCGDCFKNWVHECLLDIHVF